jgi:tetratricopeptide (TPR) repeat protein
MGADKAVMVRLNTALLALLLLTCWCEAATNAFDEANRLYEQGKFAEAASAYERVAASGGATANLWFNLGNAHYKSDRLGRAIAVYRLAERMTPRDTALRANLQFVRGKVYSDDRAHVPLWRNAVRLATVNEWTVLTVALLWGFFSVLACGEVAGRRYNKAAATLLALAILIGAGTTFAWRDLHDTEAVVIAREATVRFGPLEESQSAFQLRDGAELSILGGKNDWLEIRDPERRTGWIRRDEVVLLR